MSSIQDKLTRVRRPRVHITYKVETLGAMKEIELPFVVGVLADLSGQPKEPLKPLKQREFVQIDRDNFNEVLARANPRLAMRVQNTMTDENTEMNVELNFQKIEDFEPAQVAKQIPALAKLLETREKLTQLLSVMEGKDKVEELMNEIISNTEKAAELAKGRGISLEDEGGEGESKEEASEE